MSKEIKYRIRLDDKIVGYEKWYSGERAQDETMPEGHLYWRANPCWLYSEDGKKWNPTPIFHNQKDAFIGIRDSKGIEIYEGDIPQAGGDKRLHYVVVFRDGSFAEIHEPDDGWIHYFKDMVNNKGQIHDEVIGNKWANQELLEVNK